MSHLEYDPLKWPPEMALAQLHFDCTKPGIDNPEGARCPCCQRNEKLENSKWPSRDITKDFKNYGGGVPGYFYLMWYFVAMMIILIGLKGIYHIMLIEGVCKYIAKTYVEQGEPAYLQCSQFVGVKFLDTHILYQQLEKMGKGGDADILQYLQLAAYVVLVLGAVGMKIFFQLINKDRISLDEKLFSRFSLVIKNVPLYYQLEDLKEELRGIDPKLQFQEMFYLHKASQYSTSYKRLYDLYFELKHLEQGIPEDDREKQVTELRKKYEEYLSLYDQTMILGQGINKNSKKILVVFNTIDQKEKVHAKLKMNEALKFLHYMSKILGIKSSPIGYYSERLAEPQEIYWNNIGESSTHKQKVRLETTFLGIGFMIISFAILYFPMYKIDEQKAEKPQMGTVLGIVIGIIIIIVAILYRTVIVRLTPKRRPSSKLAELLFMCMTITVFQYFYFLVTPVTFYMLASSIPNNMKLKEFFSAILSYCLMQILIGLLDPMYRGNKKKREKLLSQASQANVYCQQRLHEEITPPSFPIDLKLMISFTFWNFNSYYIFDIPYIAIIFLITVIILYWIDKYNLYRHYKMQQYMSIQLEIKMQKTNIILFLIGASFGYYMSSQEWWEYIAVIVVVVVGLALNFGLNYTYKKQKDSILKHNTDLKSALQNCKSSFGQNMHLQMLEKEIKTSFLVAPAIEQVDLSSVSLASEMVSYGYLDTYTLFLNQFKNKRLNSLLEEKCYSIKHSKTILDGRKRQESELIHLGDDGLQQPLLGKDPQQKKEENIEVKYVSPPVVTVTFVEPANSEEKWKVEETVKVEQPLKAEEPVKDRDGERSDKNLDEE